MNDYVSTLRNDVAPNGASYGDYYKSILFSLFTLHSSLFTFIIFLYSHCILGYNISMRGLLLTNAYYSTEATRYQSDRLREEALKRGVIIDVCANDSAIARLIANNVEADISQYDFCIYLDKDKYMSAMLKKAGLRLFNSHEAIRTCDDKVDTLIALANNGIAIPNTIAGLLCYNTNEELLESFIDKVEDTLGYPLVVKESYGACGKGVYLIDNRSALIEIAKRLKTTPHFYQQYIQASHGRDVRVTVVGGVAIASMLRQSRGGEFRSNIELGGEGIEWAIPRDFADTAERASALLGLDYCGVDLLFSSSGAPVLCEVNSNAFFGGSERATGVNIAGAYIEHIIKKCTIDG